MGTAPSQAVAFDRRHPAFTFVIFVTFVVKLPGPVQVDARLPIARRLARGARI